MVEFKNLYLRLKDKLTGYSASKDKLALIPEDYSSDINYSAIFTMNEEGGYSSDRRDGGNWSSGKPYSGIFVGSKYGISAPVFIEFLKSHSISIDPQSAMQSLSVTDFKLIYKTRYWDIAEGDSLFSGLNLMIVDHGFNRGINTSIKILQSLIGVNSDGIIGPETLKVLSSYSGIESKKYLLSALQKAQIADYRSLNNETYINGWTDRAVARQITALKLLLYRDKQ